jgi:hypothetical protein
MIRGCLTVSKTLARYLSILRLAYADHDPFMSIGNVNL